MKALRPAVKFCPRIRSGFTSTKEFSMGTANNVISALEADIIQLALPTLTSIQTAFNTIASNPGNAVVLAQQEAVIVGSVNTLLVEAPALLPILQAQAISVGATQASTLLGDLIAKLQAQLPASAKA
jgi:hypothetical protein